MKKTDTRSALYWLKKHPDEEINQWYPPSLRHAKAFLKSCSFYKATLYLDKLFDDLDISYMFLPKCHPDLNPIEKLWAYMKMKISTARYRSSDETERAVEKAYIQLSCHAISRWFEQCVFSPLKS